MWTEGKNTSANLPGWAFKLSFFKLLFVYFFLTINKGYKHFTVNLSGQSPPSLHRSSKTCWLT